MEKKKLHCIIISTTVAVGRVLRLRVSPMVKGEEENHPYQVQAEEYSELLKKSKEVQENYAETLEKGKILQQEIGVRLDFPC